MQAETKAPTPVTPKEARRMYNHECNLRRWKKKAAEMGNDVTWQEARNAYMREYRRKNPDKMREYYNRRWERVAARMNDEIAAREAAEQEGGRSE